MKSIRYAIKATKPRLVSKLRSPAINRYGNVTSRYGDNWSATSLAIKKRDGFCCKRCSSIDRLEVHHIIPISRGGSNSSVNLITLCHACHSRVAGSSHRSMRQRSLIR